MRGIDFAVRSSKDGCYGHILGNFIHYNRRKGQIGDGMERPARDRQAGASGEHHDALTQNDIDLAFLNRDRAVKAAGL